MGSLSHSTDYVKQNVKKNYQSDNEALRRDYFFNVVQPSNPKIQIDKYLSANELGISGFDHPDSKSFQCGIWGVTNFKTKGNRTIFYDEFLPIIKFLDFCKSMASSTTSSTTSTTDKNAGRVDNKQVTSDNPSKPQKELVNIGSEANEEDLKLYYAKNKIAKDSEVYVYRNERGLPVQIKTRTPNKKFGLFHWDGENWQRKGYKINSKVLFYGMEQIATLPVGGDQYEKPDIYLVEGEKCAEALKKAGFLALAYPGANTYTGLYYDPLKKIDANYHIWPDNDEPGYHCADKMRVYLPEAKIIPKSILNPKKDGGDAADLTTQQIIDVITRYHEDINKLSTLKKNWMSCIFEVDKEKYLVPIDPTQAAIQGRENFNGQLKKISRMSLKRYVQETMTLDGISILHPMDGPDRFAWKKGIDEVKRPSELLKIFLHQQEQYKKLGEIYENPIMKLPGQPCYQKDIISKKISVYSKTTPFIYPDDSIIPIDVVDTDVYRQVLIPVLGDKNASIFCAWLSRYFAFCETGKDFYIRRLPIMNIMGAPKLGKSAIASIITRIHGGVIGDLIKYARDPNGFGSTQLANYFMLADDPDGDIDKKFAENLRVACKRIHTGALTSIERKGVDAFTSTSLHAAMLLSNTDENNLKVLRELTTPDMKDRCAFLVASGDGMFKKHGGPILATKYMSELLDDHARLYEFFISVAHVAISRIENKDEGDYFFDSYLDEQTNEYFEQVSPHIEIQKFLTWLHDNFRSKESVMYVDMMNQTGQGKFLYRDRASKKTQVRICMSSLKDFYNYYRDTQYPGENSTLVRYLRGEHENDRGAISPLSKSDTLRGVTKDMKNVFFGRKRTDNADANCIFYEVS